MSTLLLVGGLVLLGVLWLLLRKRKKPISRAALTRRLRENFRLIKEAKLLTLARRKVPPQTAAWLETLGREICQVGLVTEKLNVEEKFAAIFAVNELFHNDVSGAKQMKNYLQRTIVVHHRKEVRLTLVRTGEYAGTYAIRRGVWVTHLPIAVVDQGALERRGRPSARKALRRK